MKFLLVAVNAKYIHSNPAVYSLRAYAGGKEFEEDVDILEFTINHKTENILSAIYKSKPDVIAFSCYIWNWTLIQEIVNELHKIMPTLPIWLGGPEVSFDAEKILREYPMITGIMIGEGEKTFVSLLKYYQQAQGAVEKSRELSGINGIVYRDSEEIISTKEQELTDISTLPFLYGDLNYFKNRIIYYESSRGCPYRCSYCLSAIDKKVRMRDIEIVKTELQFFLDHQVNQVKFVDRTFNCNHEHTMEIWNYIYEHDNGITNFHFEIAADIMKENELNLLSKMRPGLVQLEIGVQSANAETLKEINRYTDMIILEKNVKRIREHKNVHVHLDLIAGLPYEDYESFGNSFNTVHAMEPEQLQLGFLKVLKGSPMHERADLYGVRYTSQPPYEVLYTKWLSYDGVCKLKQIEEMVELYYNSNQFTHTIPVLQKAFESAFSMYEKLAEYYEEKGYFVNSPSRAYRYDVLLGFACSYDVGREELYKELLTYDIYLRENMKSRPGFAQDLSCYKDRIRDFYAEEDKVKKLLPAYHEYQIRQITKMVHIDVFKYAVWEENADKRMAESEMGMLVLFDYKKRNPLTKEASILLV